MPASTLPMTAMEPTQKSMEQETKAWAKPPSDLESFLSASAPRASTRSSMRSSSPMSVPTEVQRMRQSVSAVPTTQMMPRPRLTSASAAMSAVVYFSFIFSRKSSPMTPPTSTAPEFASTPSINKPPNK